MLGRGGGDFGGWEEGIGGGRKRRRWRRKGWKGVGARFEKVTIGGGKVGGVGVGDGLGGGGGGTEEDLEEVLEMVFPEVNVRFGEREEEGERSFRAEERDITIGVDRMSDQEAQFYVASQREGDGGSFGGSAGGSASGFEGQYLDLFESHPLRDDMGDAQLSFQVPRSENRGVGHVEEVGEDDRGNLSGKKNIVPRALHQEGVVPMHEQDDVVVPQQNVVSKAPNEESLEKRPIDDNIIPQQQSDSGDAIVPQNSSNSTPPGPPAPIAAKKKRARRGKNKGQVLIDDDVELSSQFIRACIDNTDDLVLSPEDRRRQTRKKRTFQDVSPSGGTLNAFAAITGLPHAGQELQEAWESLVGDQFAIEVNRSGRKRRRKSQTPPGIAGNEGTLLSTPKGPARPLEDHPIIEDGMPPAPPPIAANEYESGPSLPGGSGPGSMDLSSVEVSKSPAQRRFNTSELGEPEAPRDALFERITDADREAYANDRVAKQLNFDDIDDDDDEIGKRKVARTPGSYRSEHSHISLEGGALDAGPVPAIGGETPGSDIIQPTEARLPGDDEFLDLRESQFVLEEETEKLTQEQRHEAQLGGKSPVSQIDIRAYKALRHFRTLVPSDISEGSVPGTSLGNVS